MNSPAPTPPRAADILAKRLYDAGCRYAFGMPGGEVLTLVDALERAGIKFVLAMHENAAGFMAEGVHHRTGAPAILVATVGPGAVNGINVVVNALQDRVPMLVLTGCVDPDETQTYTHQVMDQPALFRTITKHSFTFHPGAAYEIADKALGMATEGQPGPVHIDIPISVADTVVTKPEPPRRAVAAPVVPAPGVLAEAREWLAQARNPLIISGVDAVNGNAGPALTKFAETFGVPVIASYKAKGLLAEDHPLALGGAGLSPLADKSLLAVVDAADLVICVGYDPIEMRPGWRDPWDPATKRVIDITSAPNHHFMHQSTLHMIADCAETLDALGDGLTPSAVWAGSEIADFRSAIAKAFPKDDAWGPAAVIAECREVLPRDVFATADSGAHRILLSQMWDCYEPRGLIQSSALCTMGCAVPMAMGSALAAPDRPVVSFSGDAGFLMVAGELATASELGLKPIFVVFVDASLALIDLKQRQRQLSNAGVDMETHDFAAIAKAFGGAGHNATNREELRAALTSALEADTFTVIAAHIEREAYDGRI